MYTHMDTHFIVAIVDYTSISMTVGTFTSQRARQCFSISIINDFILERTEDFTARLTLIPASVTTIDASSKDKTEVQAVDGHCCFLFLTGTY